MNKIEAALPETLAEVGLRELPSEQTRRILHKVWIGPLTSPERVRSHGTARGLGVKKPMRVQSISVVALIKIEQLPRNKIIESTK